MTAPRPSDAGEVRDAIADAVRDGGRIAIRGGGSKDGVGRDCPDATILDMSGLAGGIDYDPPELVLTAGAGTPLAEIQALVAGEGQMLAFEPFDHGPLFGRAAGAATIGGVIAAGVAGSQRLAHGGARDHLLGFEGVSGRGEAFVAGAKVVKNVTGYDLSKLVTGSWGRLVALTAVTLKVLPRPRKRATVAVEGLGVAEAVAAMARAMGSPAEVSAAAHVPAQGGWASHTVLRVQGFGPSVAARAQLLEAALPGARTLGDEDAAAVWEQLRTLAPLADSLVLWRVNVPPSAAPALVAAAEAQGARWLIDWAGGLVWIGAGEPGAIRAAAQAAGGHATLVRAPEAIRATTPALHPQPSAVAALEERVRRAFDPAGVFETGRF